MIRKSLIAFSLLLSTNIFASPLWEDIDTNAYANAKHLPASLAISPPAYTARHLLLDEDALHQKLFSASAQKSLSTQAKLARSRFANDEIFNLPLPDGSLIAVVATEYSIMGQKLASHFPEFKSWRIKAIDQNIKGNINFTALGFHAMLMLENGDTIFIEPDRFITSTAKQLKQGKKRYNSFSKRKNKHLFQRKYPIDEIVIPSQKNISTISEKPQERLAKSLITYRLALAATGEYTALNGGTKESAFSAMYITIDRVNSIYRRDLTIQLQLIDTDKLIYLNKDTDPYSNGDPYQMLDENITNLEAVIGNDNYDIGHLFGGDGTGGLALMSVVCNNDKEAHKAGGVTGSPSPYGATFDIDYVAHEMGHQFGAAHTFDSIKESCGGNREATSAVEPGSGSTIMSYAGICAEDDLQFSSDAVFHAVSIQQINRYIRESGEATCGIKSSTDNNKPRFSTTTPQTYYIPTKTPFFLQANANDADTHDILSYTWDEIDIANSSSELGLDTGDNPLFRSYLPSILNKRYFPQLSTLFDQPTMKGETMPLTQRELNFVISVRDDKGGIARTDAKITTSGNIPFEVTSQTNPSVYHSNETIEVKWQEAGTSWAPINCSEVDIKLITQAGLTQDLLLQTANDGIQALTLSDQINPVSNARIMVACHNNVFFALSKGAVAINPPFTEDNQYPIATVNSPSILEGDSGFKTLNYTINLTEPTEKEASINYNIYNTNDNTLVKTGLAKISQGQTSTTITQIISGNTIPDDNQNYQLTLFSPQNIQFASQQNLITFGTVIDDDIKTSHPDSENRPNSAGGNLDSILTFLLLYISLLRLRFKAKKYRKTGAV